MKGIFRTNGIALCVVMLFSNTVLAETTFITDKIAVELFSSTFQRGVLVTTVNSGAIVQVLETDGDFAKVSAPDGQAGWLHKKYLSTEKPTQVSYLQLMAKHKLLEEELATLKSQVKNSAEADKEVAMLGKIRGDLSYANKTIHTLETQLKEKTTALEQSKRQLAALEKQHQETIKAQPVVQSKEPPVATAAPSVPVPAPAPEVEPQPPAEAPAALSPPTPPATHAFNLDYPIALKWLLLASLLSILLGTYWGYSWLDNKIARKHGGVRIR